MTARTCICDWPDECDGSGNLQCVGCSGDVACWCKCGGDDECLGCSVCAAADDYDEPCACDPDAWGGQA